jgi:hypothetical protein
MEGEAHDKGLVWDLYREHIKKFSHAKVRGEPTLEEMKETFRTLVPEMSITVLAQEKVGMIVQFHHLASYPANELMPVSDVGSFLSERFGGGKFKLNLYRGINFLSTKNYETHGDPLWKHERNPE